MLQNNKSHTHWLLMAHGEPFAEEQRLKKLAQHRRVMVLDGAYDWVQKISIPVDVVLGDFDSISPAQLTHIKQHTEITVVHAPDQDYSDFEKGIHYLDQLGAQDIVIVAATGFRLQHTLHNLRMLKRYYHVNRALTVVNTHETVFYKQDTTFKVQGQVGQSIGLMGFPEAVISTHGLKYEVKHYAMVFEQASSMLNALAAEEAEIEVEGGVLCVFDASAVGPEK